MSEAIDLAGRAPAGASFKAGVSACMPTVLGYWSIGFAAGAIGSLAGFSILEISLLAGLLYAGSAQFLFYSLAAAGAGFLPIVLGVLLVNTRYVLMSSYMSMFFVGKGPLEKFVGGALLTDETFGVAAQYAKANGNLPFAWLLGLNLTAYVNWIAANLAGAILASSMPSSLTKGLGFSLTAMFVGLLLLTYFASATKMREAVAIGVASAIVLTLGFGSVDQNMSILFATVAGAMASVLSSRFAARRASA